MADFKFNCPHCKQSLEAPQEMLGQQVNCPSCNGVIRLPSPTPAPQPVTSTPPLRPAPPPPPPLEPRQRAVPYAVKVLTSKDRFLSGKFDPEKVEAALNAYAAEGWSLADCDSASFPGILGGDRSELVTVMHRVGGRMKKYKVLTQKDRFFSGKFDPDKIEAAINSYVQEGWMVRAVTSASFPGLLSANREELIVLLEKEV